MSDNQQAAMREVLGQARAALLYANRNLAEFDGIDKPTESAIATIDAVLGGE